MQNDRSFNQQLIAALALRKQVRDKFDKGIGSFEMQD